MIALLSNQTTNGTGTAYLVPGTSPGEEKVEGTLYADPASVFAGGTAEVQGSLDNVTWHTLPAGDLTTPGEVKRITFEANYLRGRLVGAGGGANVTVRFGSRVSPTPA